jgi:hypothetical protein
MTDDLYSFLPECSSSLLQLLIAIIDQRPHAFPTISRAYYNYLSALFTTNKSGDLDKDLILTAIKVPLVEQSRKYFLSLLRFIATEFIHETDKSKVRSSSTHTALSLCNS